jgi:hypothetical protein
MLTPAFARQASSAGLFANPPPRPPDTPDSGAPVIDGAGVAPVLGAVPDVDPGVAAEEFLDGCVDVAWPPELLRTETLSPAVNGVVGSVSKVIVTVFPFTDVIVPGVPRPPPKPPAAKPEAPGRAPVADADADAPKPPNPVLAERLNADAAPNAEAVLLERCPYQIPADPLVTTTRAIAKIAVYLFVHL